MVRKLSFTALSPSFTTRRGKSRTAFLRTVRIRFLSYWGPPMTIRHADFAPDPPGYRLRRRGSSRRILALRRDRASRPAKSNTALQHQRAFVTVLDLR